MNPEDFILPSDFSTLEGKKAKETAIKEAKKIDDWLRKEILKIFPNEDFKDLNALRDKLCDHHFILTVQENSETKDYIYSLFRNQEYISQIVLQRSSLVQLRFFYSYKVD